MSEKPILFTGQMVKAVLDQRKWQTRRIETNIQVGDILWLKETWRIGAWYELSHEIAVDYKADGYCRKEWIDIENDEMFYRFRKQSIEDAVKIYGQQDEYKWSPGESPCRWRSGRFMPKVCARPERYLVTGKREELLQDITEKDALAEGVTRRMYHWHGRSREGYSMDWSKLGTFSKVVDRPLSIPDICLNTPRFAFANYWNIVNAKRGYRWDTNPLVKVIEFKLISPGQKPAEPE